MTTMPAFKIALQFFLSSLWGTDAGISIAIPLLFPVNFPAHAARRAEFGDSRYNKVNLCNYAGSLRDLQNDKVRWIKKGVKRNAKITPFLWFDNQAEEALNFYASIFNNSRIGSITRYGAGGPGPDGTVMTAIFQLEGQEFMALNGGPVQKSNRRNKRFDRTHRLAA